MAERQDLSLIAWNIEKAIEIQEDLVAAGRSSELLWVRDCKRLLDYALGLEREAAEERAALEMVRAQLDMRLPSEQIGPEWEQTVRVPVARLRVIDSAIAGVLGQPTVTGEPMPPLHGPALASLAAGAPGEGTS